MRFSDRPFFVLHTLALTMIVVQGKFREANGLIHKPKALHAGPKSTAATAWTATNNESTSFPHPPRKNTNQVRPQSQQYNARQQGQSEKSTEMNMTRGNTGMQNSQRRTLSLSPSRRLLLASMLTVAALWKTKTAIGWFLSNMMFTPYQNSLVNNPLVTKVFTGAVLAIVGDAVAQATSNEAALANQQTKIGYDKRRALSFAAFDSCYRVFQHNVFPWVIRSGQGNVIKRLLPKIIPSQNMVAFFSPAAAAIEQTAIYQFVIVPFLYYPIFFTFTGFIQGLSLTQSIDRMKRQYFPCWRRNLMFWIPTQMVLFGVVAEKWQIPFACLMGMIWSTILSKTAGNTKKQ